LLLALVDQVQLLVAILLLHHSLQLAVEVVALQVVVALAENSNHLVVLDQDSQETLAEAQHTNLDHMTLAVVVVVLEVLVEIQAAVLEVMAVQALLLQ
jgi:hypothetical protein